MLPWTGATAEPELIGETPLEGNGSLMVCPSASLGNSDAFFEITRVTSAQNPDAYFGIYHNGHGGFATHFSMGSDKVANSKTILGFHLQSSGDLPPTGSLPLAFNWTSTLTGTAGACGERLDPLQPGTLYTGRLQGAILEIRTKTTINCEILVEAELKSSGFWWWVVFAGGSSSKHTLRESAEVVCANGAEITVTPDVIYDVAVRVLPVPMGGLLVCGTEAANWDETTCALAPES